MNIWPGNPSRGGGGAPAKAVPKWVTLPASTVAAYPLSSTLAPLGVATDRGPNGYHLQPVTAYFGCPDIVSGNNAVSGCLVLPIDGGVQGSGTYFPQLDIVGALTVVMRVALWSDAIYSSVNGWIAGFGDYGPAHSSAPGFSYSLWAEDHPARYLFYFAEGAGKTSITWKSSLSLNNDKLFSYVSLRRNTAGTVVRLGLNKAYQSSPVLAPAVAVGAGGVPAFMKLPNLASISGGSGLPGFGADAVICNTMLTDAQVNALQDEAFGSYAVAS
jgi:hypothetical protein